jgi:hypothetical protein
VDDAHVESDFDFAVCAPADPAMAAAPAAATRSTAFIFSISLEGSSSVGQHRCVQGLPVQKQSGTGDIE